MLLALLLAVAVLGACRGGGACAGAGRAVGLARSSAALARAWRCCACCWCVVVQERRSAMGKGRHRLARLHALGACRAAGAPAAPPGAPAAGGALGAGAVQVLVLLRVCCRGRCTLNVDRVKSAVSTRAGKCVVSLPPLAEVKAVSTCASHARGLLLCWCQVVQARAGVTPPGVFHPHPPVPSSGARRSDQRALSAL